MNSLHSGLRPAPFSLLGGHERSHWMVRWQIQQLDAGLQRRASHWKDSGAYARLRESLSEDAIGSLLHAMAGQQMVVDSELVLARCRADLHAALVFSASNKPAQAPLPASDCTNSLTEACWVGPHELYASKTQWLSSCVTGDLTGDLAGIAVAREVGAWGVVSALREHGDMSWLRALRAWSYLAEEARQTVEDVDRHLHAMAAAIPAMSIIPKASLLEDDDTTTPLGPRA